MGVKAILIIIVFLILILASIFFFTRGQTKVATTTQSEPVQKVLQNISKNKTISNESNQNISQNWNFFNQNKTLRKIVLKQNVTTEEIILDKPKDYLTVGEKLYQVFGHYVQNEHLPTFLKSEPNENYGYTQQIRIDENLNLTQFSDDDYLDGNTTVGFNLSSRDKILTYELNFNEEVSNDDLFENVIRILGKPYFVLEANISEKKLRLLKMPYTFNLLENETVLIDSPLFGKENFSIKFLNKDKVLLNVNGKEIPKINEKGIYQKENFTIYVKEIFFGIKNFPNNVEIVISPKELNLEEGTLLLENKKIRGIEISFYPSDKPYWKRIKIQWRVMKKTFFSVYDPLIMPYFENLFLSIGNFKLDKNIKYWEITLNTLSYDTYEEKQLQKI